MANRFTLVALPDTQIYARDHAEIFEAQGRWIAENAEELGIRAVIHEGDVVFYNDDAQWSVARRALAPVVGRADLIFALGNHDYGTGGACDTRATLLHDYFPVEELAGQPGFGGAFEAGRVDNCFHLVGEWLVLALEFAPRDAVVEWAREVLTTHARRPAVLATHAYLYHDHERYDRARRPEQKWSPHAYGIARSESINDGQALWDKLVSKHDNVRLVLCGHVIDPGVARRSETRPDGSWCHQLLCNFQTDREGGAGFLRIMEVVAGGATMKVRTYSPWLDEHRRGAEHEMELPLR